ncbi:T9SS type A sorting domain-containing protein [Hymenobacter tibetensis]|uniref:T9SS type A sorting domain-containing protein n=1 Tax=Hymenobacter tibetensis TaxID=497967 RepID=A0ABY4CWT5_9BACT|nr:T9SS type A sorting domain-containing protein [Hymenobacter tibetensis]UOG74736.1 T9SS type A sorting domain-containing protein [Hymenobacter tibetensis]
MKVFSTFGGAVVAGLLTSSISAFAQQTPLAWQQVQRFSVGTTGLRTSTTDAAGNTYVIGGFLGTAQFGSSTFTSPANSSEGDGFLAKLDAQGAVLWARQIAGIRSEHINGVAVDAAGTVTIAGTLQHAAVFDATTTLQGASIISNDLFVARYDANGTVLWARSYGGPLDNEDTMTGSGVAVDAAGNSYVAGGLRGTATVGTTTLSSTASREVPVLLKLAANGDVAWVRQGQLTTNPSTSQYGGGSTAVAVDAAGNAVLCGNFDGSLNLQGTTLQASSTQGQIFVAHFDAAGNLQWARQSTGSTKATPHAVSLDAAGNTYMAGEYEGTTAFGSLALAASGQGTGYLVKFDPNGSTQWARTIGGSQYATAKSLAVTPAGDAYITGQFEGSTLLDVGTTLTSQGGSDIFITCYSTQGDLRWAQQAGGTNPDTGSGVGVDVIGQVYVTGTSIGQATFGAHTISGYTPFVAKLAAQPLSTTASGGWRKLAFSPNPATEVLRLSGLPVGTKVVLADALGRAVRQNITVAAAAVTQVSVADLVPGTYLLRATDPAGLQYSGRLVVQ